MNVFEIVMIRKDTFLYDLYSSRKIIANATAQKDRSEGTFTQ